MPWWSSGSIIDNSVVSWPPCKLDVEVKTPAGTPINEPFSQRSEVLSIKYLSGAAMLPKRVGLPSRRPAQSAKSDCWQNSGPSSGISSATASQVLDIVGTVRRRAAIPADSTPIANCSAS